MEQKESAGWKSRKFWSAAGSSFAVLTYAGTARALEWVSESSLEYLVTISLVAISVYCGFNIAEKLGGVGALFGLRGQK